MNKVTNNLECLNIHDDYTLYMMWWAFIQQYHSIVSYMQTYTKYGDAYENAYNQANKIRKQMKKLEDALQKCNKNKKVGEK